ncbi:hypothetical protein L1887_55238 [Cichorium endivia]|nr:hypothetical protein L1887_55238 [Cichorium endivia]
METGQPSRRPLEVAFNDALADPMARTIFIRHLQSLRATTEAFLSAIVASTRKMPYGRALHCARGVPRAAGQVPQRARGGADQGRRPPGVLPLPQPGHRGARGATTWSTRSSGRYSARIWPSADEFLDHTVAAEAGDLHFAQRDLLDARAAHAAAGPPRAARRRSAARHPGRAGCGARDPEAETKALFVETKRLVLSLLKVQSGKTLVDVFVAPVTDKEELQWEEIVSLEVAAERQRQRGQRPPGIPLYGGAAGARLEDVRRLSFAELKARTLENMLQLEQLGKVSRANNDAGAQGQEAICAAVFAAVLPPAQSQAEWWQGAQVWLVQVFGCQAARKGRAGIDRWRWPNPLPPMQRGEVSLTISSDQAGVFTVEVVQRPARRVGLGPEDRGSARGAVQQCDELECA